MRRLVRRRRVFEGRRVTVRLDEVEFPGGQRVEYEIVEHPGAVAMVALTADRHVVLVRQYRAAVEADLLEIPAGTMEPGETPERCAERELAEEVGRAAGRWECLSAFYPSPGILSEVLHVFLAQDLRPAAADREEVDLRVETVALDEARRRIDSGEIRDAKSVIGIALACRRLGRPG
ncbi:MAG TPA: NUDIX hydrolase [bacterium]|nr:NUDIX hydrolase [bacterium]